MSLLSNPESSRSDNVQARAVRPELEVAQLVDSVCDAFESAWQSGSKPKLADFLSDTKLPVSTLFVELVQIDIEYRRQQGEKVTLEQYARAYPEFSGLLSNLGPLLDTVPTRPASPPSKGPVIGRFQLVEPLGEGTFGVVWKARDTQMRRWVAIKRFRESVLVKNRELFAREARAVEKLDHPNVVRLLELSQATTTDYIVFEYVDGKSLKALLQENPGQPFEPDRAARIAEQLAAGLQHVHERGIIHRDFKPGNILLTRGEPATATEAGPGRMDSGRTESDRPETAKIVDFGLARHTESVSTISNEKALLGTVPYMSPEQCRGEGVTALSDVYALGAVLYEMLAGHRPFAGSQADLIGRIPKGNPPPFEAPDSLQTIVRRAMEVDPLDRYGSAREMAVDLARWLNGEPVRRARPNLRRFVTKLSSRRSLLATGFGIVVASAATAGLLRSAPEKIVDGKHAVTVTTEPANATVHFFPLSNDGRPRAAPIVGGSHRSPVNVRLLPGDYLIVARLEDGGRFHEVYRHVPKNPSVYKGHFRHVRWEVDGEGTIILPKIVIPEDRVADGMVRVKGLDRLLLPEGQSCRVPEFLVDSTEFTVGDYKRLVKKALNRETDLPKNLSLDRNDPDDRAVNVNFDEAMALAELEGKRLLHDWEFQVLRTAGGTSRHPWGDQPPPASDSLPEFGAVRTPAYDRFETPAGSIFGIESNVAEWVDGGNFLGSRLREPDGLPESPAASRRRVRGGGFDSDGEREGLPSETATESAVRTLTSRYSARPGLGFRCARSVQPRLVERDFPDLLGFAKK